MKQVRALLAAATGAALSVAGLGALAAPSYAMPAPDPAEAVAAIAAAIPSFLQPTPTTVRTTPVVQRGEASMGWRTAGQAPAPGFTKPIDAASSGAVYGIDVASHQGNVNWKYWYGQGKRFAYVKATEGTYYRNPYFAQQYNGSYRIGMIRGAYHFATPNTTSGYTQAKYFVAHGGGWSRDGKTLPGVLDIEWNPYGSSCYGKSHSGMVSWIKSFTTEYKRLTHRDAVIYTAKSWWIQCTGNSSAFHTTNPLWVADLSGSVDLFGGWGFHTIRQYSSSPLDKDQFNGNMTRLKALANG